MRKQRYTVRPLGKTEWGKYTTIRAALKGAKEARDRMSDTIIIFDEKLGVQVNERAEEE